MAFIFTCGTHRYENITAQCQNCGNFSAKVYKRWEWFTFCFIPIIPFSMKPYHDVGCHICHFYQDLKYRPDVENQHNGGQPIPMQNYGPGGPNGGPPQGWGPPSGAQQQQQQQQQQGYK